MAKGRDDTEARLPGKAPGIGDRLFLTLGNGGYDARHYHLDLTYPTAAPQQTVDGEVTMLARAIQSLSRFNLDFADGTVSEVEVNGRDAQYELSGGELAITPRRYIRDGSKFLVEVDFTAGPDAPVDEFPFGWFTTNDGSVTAGQPDLGHTIYPVNDHPADKATYTFRLDVPAGVTAVASGEQLWSRTRGGRTVSVHEMDEPMASELTQIAVGDLRVIDRGRHRVRLERRVARAVRAGRCADLERAVRAVQPERLRGRGGRPVRPPADDRRAGRDLSRFAQEWLYSTTVPPMPGHPDWELDPAGADAPAARAHSHAKQLERMLHKR